MPVENPTATLFETDEEITATHAADEK